MTKKFRARVNSKVLCTSSNLKVILVMSLKTFNIANTHTSCKIRIFTKSLLTSSPSWITENIYIRRPECKSLINICIIVLLLHIIFCSSFCRNCICNFLSQIFIKCGSKTNCLWENCSHTSSCNTVKTFIPPIICLDTKTFNSCCMVKCLRNFLIKSHLGYKFSCSIFVFFLFFVVMNKFHLI